MHAELGGFWFNLILVLSGLLYGSYRLMKREEKERKLEEWEEQ